MAKMSYRPTGGNPLPGQCAGVLDPRDQAQTTRTPTDYERKLLGNGFGWGVWGEAQPEEFTRANYRMARPRLRCLVCGGRFKASYMVGTDGDLIYFRLPPHKPHKVGGRKTKKVFGRRGNP